jgi:hypothetical protein
MFNGIEFHRSLFNIVIVKNNSHTHIDGVFTFASQLLEFQHY